MSSFYYIDRSDINLEDVVFNQNVSEQINDFLQEQQFKEKLIAYKLPIANKILMYGATGCGKTMTAKAIAKHLNKKLVIVNLATIISSKLGETSKNIDALFKEAQYEGLVLFFDEFDSLGQIRDYDNKDNSEMKRVVNAILQLIDNFPQKSILMAATNQIQMIDEALKRRFELYLEFTNPTNETLDLYYDKLLANFPETYQSINRIYNTSFAEAKNSALFQIKKNIINTEIKNQKADK